MAKKKTRQLPSEPILPENDSNPSTLYGPDCTSNLTKALRRTRKSPATWVGLAALCLLLASYGFRRVALLSDAPYEGWDEVAGYHSASALTGPARWRVYAYGTLDLAKMVLARWYYNTTDPLANTLRIKPYSNNVLSSWAEARHFAPGKLNLAFNLNGSTDYVRITGSGTINGPRTLTAWVFPRARNGGMPVFSAGSSGVADFLFIDGAQLGVAHWGRPAYLSSLPVKPEAWNYVAFSYDGKTLLFYVNGRVSTPIPAALYDYAIETAEIGGNTIGGNAAGPSFDGLIDDVRLYSRPLDAREIFSVSPPAGGLLSYWSADGNANDQISGNNGFIPSAAFDIQAPNWKDITAIDYDHFRGIADRKPFLIAREINLAFIYLLCAALIIIATQSYKLAALPLYCSVAFLLSSPPFFYDASFQLPNAACAVIAQMIVTLCLTAIYLDRPRLVLVASVFLAIGVNHKADFLMLGVPVGIGAIVTGGRSAGELLRRAAQSVLCFGVTLTVTNPYLLIAPRSELARHAAVLTALQQAVDAQRNLDILWRFLGACLSPTPDSAVAGVASLGVLGTIGIIVLSLLSGLPLAAGEMSLRQRVGALFLLIGTLAVLFMAPVLRSSVLYERYFLNGWASLLAAAGCGMCVVIARTFSRSSRPLRVLFVAALLLPTSLVAVRYHGVRKLEASVTTHLDPVLRIDTRWTRNRATIEALRVAETGGFSRSILIDQHLYLDLRPFVARNISPIYINCFSYKHIISRLAPGTYMSIFTRGTSDITPGWVGRWPPEVQSQYQEYIDFLGKKPVIWSLTGPLTKLLDWGTPSRSDNISIAAITVGR